MFLKTAGRFQNSRHSFGSGFCHKSQNSSFNMTPVIDIVFLLIIFFLVVCQFIEAENFPVLVPDDCDFAQSFADTEAAAITVTVIKAPDEGCTFAVGPEKISTSRHSDIVESIAHSIDARLRNLPPDRRVVTLRIDKDICFDQAQFALAGIAASTATDIKLAALKNKRPDVQ